MARLPGVKVALFAVVLVALLGIVALAVVREAALPPPARLARPMLEPPRPPLTPAEEQYALALWPIHNEVKASALKMTFSGLSYKLGQIDKGDLKRKIEASRQVYQKAEGKISALKPPASMATQHRSYLEAVRLYNRSAEEILHMYQDGRDEHLATAHPMSQEAGVILLTVGNVLWPTEYKPN